MNYQTAEVSYSFKKEINQVLVFNGSKTLDTRKRVYFSDFGLQSMEIVKGLAINTSQGGAQIETTDYTNGGVYTNMGQSELAKLRLFLYDNKNKRYAVNGIPMATMLLQAPITALSKTPYLRLNHEIDWSKSYIYNNAVLSAPSNAYILQFRIIL